MSNAWKKSWGNSWGVSWGGEYFKYKPVKRIAKMPIKYRKYPMIRGNHK